MWETVLSYVYITICLWKCLWNTLSSSMMAFYNVVVFTTIVVHVSCTLLELTPFHILNMLKIKFEKKIWKELTSIFQIWIIFTHLKLWIASARHNFKWVKLFYLNFQPLEIVSRYLKCLKVTHICFIWDQALTNIDVYTVISFPRTVIYSANKMC